MMAIATINRWSRTAPPCLLLALVLAVPIPRAGAETADARIAINTDFPGGNVLVQKNAGATVSIAPGRRGATASASSVAKIDFSDTPGGVSYILDLHPTAVGGDGGSNKLAALIRGFFDAGGMEIGLNVYDEATLRAAQQEPERYQGFMVRLFGFSTQFVALSPEQQEFVIARTRHGAATTVGS